MGGMISAAGNPPATSSSEMNTVWSESRVINV
jgi:hypothetical protein